MVNFIKPPYNKLPEAKSYLAMEVVIVNQCGLWGVSHLKLICLWQLILVNLL